MRSRKRMPREKSRKIANKSSAMFVDVPRGDQFSVENPWPYSRFSTLHPRLSASSPFPSSGYNRLIRFSMPSGDAQEWIIQYSISCPLGYTGTYQDLAIRRTLSSQRKLRELRDSHSYNQGIFPGSIVKSITRQVPNWNSRWRITSWWYSARN